MYCRQETYFLFCEIKEWNKSVFDMWEVNIRKKHIRIMGGCILTSGKDRKNILLVCNTYYQLILAIQMKRTIFINEQVDLWLSDHSVGAEEVVDRIKKEKIFVNVKYIKTRQKVYDRSKFSKIKEQLDINFGEIGNYDLPLYDEIIFHNFDMDFYRIGDLYQKIGHEVVWSKFEEGILSYSYSDLSSNCVVISELIRKFTRRKRIVPEIKFFYCTDPEFKKDYFDCVLKKVPRINSDDRDMQKILNNIFDYEPVNYKQKYIFFASSSDIDGTPCGETELVLKIANEVGKENLLVKMHPRDTRNVYEERGIAVMRNSFVPWEVIQMNGLPSDTVFLTLTSGAFLSASVLLNQNIRGIYLYPAVECKTETFKRHTSVISRAINQLHDKNMFMGISVMNDYYK